MIISRTPFRITTAGGGTDLKSFYQYETGAVVNASINKYMYITVNKKFDDSIRIGYSKTENVDNVNQIKHPVVREAMKLTGVTKGIEITSMADIPSKGTGLGSSSSFTVGLLNALYAHKGKHRSAKQLAEEACLIERGILKEPGGKQDQYIAAYGGICLMEFKIDHVTVNPIICSPKTKKELDNNLLMFYTGITRSSAHLSKKLAEGTKNKMIILRKMRDLAFEVRDSLVNNDLTKFGNLFHKNWLLKTKTAGGISHSVIDSYYNKALNAGALGGKLMGAGGGGFLLIYAEKKKQNKVRKALKNLKETKFSFEPQGSKIIYVSD